MNAKRWAMACGVFAAFAVSCDSVTNPGTEQPQDLAPPLGLVSVTGSGAVTLSWQGSNYGEDREGFQIYQAAGLFSKTVTGLTDGTTYSFLVVAFKDGGAKISRPSDVVTDTPRRESGLLDLTNGAGNERFLVVDSSPPSTSAVATGADLLCQSFNAGAGDRPGLVGQGGTRVQDVGFVDSWDEIDRAPLGSGSYPDASHSVEVLAGHVYAVFTSDNHYAKVWVSSLHTGDLGYACRVAYQPQAGNNDLKPR